MTDKTPNHAPQPTRTLNVGQNMNMRAALLIVLMVILAGCGTYYDPSDDYVRGLRWYDRGRMDLAEQLWLPLVAKSDPDAEFRLGWMLWNNQRGENRELEAIDLFRKAAEQGQTKALLILADLYYQSPSNPHLAGFASSFSQGCREGFESLSEGGEECLLCPRQSETCFHSP